MEDPRTIREVMSQIKKIEQNNLNNTEYISGIDLLLTSDNNGTVKDAEISKKFSMLKEKMMEVNNLTEEFVSVLEAENK